MGGRGRGALERNAVVEVDFQSVCRQGQATGHLPKLIRKVRGVWGVCGCGCVWGGGGGDWGAGGLERNAAVEVDRLSVCRQGQATGYSAKLFRKVRGWCRKHSLLPAETGSSLARHSGRLFSDVGHVAGAQTGGGGWIVWALSVGCFGRLLPDAPGVGEGLCAVVGCTASTNPMFYCAGAGHDCCCCNCCCCCLGSGS
jgi:hypothetical protein